MSRILSFAVVLLLITGCCMEERTPLRLLPEDAVPLSFPEMLSRAQKQVGLAMEAYYTDEWLDLEEAARALGQTARLLPKATAPPAKLEKTLPALSADLAREATELGEAAHAKDSRRAHATLQSLLPKIRSLHKES